jgi:putative tributyrin esterase
MDKFFTVESGFLPANQQKLRLFTVKSPSLGRRADVSVYNPQSDLNTENLPVVILLHGVYGSHWAWTVSGRATEILEEVISGKSCKPMLLVMPSDGLFDDGSGYVPHNDADYEKWIVSDVLQLVRENYTQVSALSPVFIAGLSMGGFGALRLGAKYPEIFSGFSGMSSITHFDQLNLFVQNFSKVQMSARVQDGVIDWMVKNRAALPPFRFDCGAEDLLIEFNRSLHDELEKMQIPHQYKEYSGGHSWNYWQEHLPETLTFFSGLIKN